MDPEARRLKKIREAKSLREVPAGETLLLGFSLADFARELAEAARHARL